MVNVVLHGIAALLVYLLLLEALRARAPARRRASRDARDPRPIALFAALAFGLRFSNLTHRGILTHGPYAWTKHPAYVSKNRFWWFATMPFLATTGNPVDMIRNSAVLAMISGVYYWRAKTEEKHLMADPAYRDYAAWMERNGPIPRLVNALKPRWARPADPVAAE